ncbi:hypothetical protein [Microbacterium telephonicum]|uniref:hypothetical protein n=1 Tax=Microbacterium telephonicum TaxID=1714841 RepID=UPI000EB3B063
MTLLDVSARVVDSAATVAVDRGLRGYDAVHLASAALLRGSDVAFVSGDRALLRAVGEEGFITVDSSGGGR